MLLEKNPCVSLKVLVLHIFALIETNETKQISAGKLKPFDINAKCNDDDYLNWFCSITTDVTLYYPCSFTDDDRKYSLLHRFLYRYSLLYRNFSDSATIGLFKNVMVFSNVT